MRTLCFSFLLLFEIIFAENYGVYLGNLTLHGENNVGGKVYVINENSFYIKNFSYDGGAPDAYFWVGKSEDPSVLGNIVPDEYGSLNKLGRYDGADIIISLPKNVKFSDIKWLSVWCKTFNVNFGFVRIPSDFEAPKELTLPKLTGRTHKVKSGRIIFRNSKTITIYGLHYDGAAPDAFFLVGKGSPNKYGQKVPDENGRTGIIKGYNGEDITLRLPNNLTWFDLDWFALYCISYTENLGDVKIPSNLNIPIDVTTLMKNEIPVLKNCHEIFSNQLRVRWKIGINDIIIQLEGRAGAGEYLSFGISGQENQAVMIGADVVVAFYDESKSAVEVVDYYLSSRAQCSVNDGACPDDRIGGHQNVQLLKWRYENNIIIATYRRLLNAPEQRDKTIEFDKSTTVVAAIGPLNSRKEAAKHTKVTRDPILIHFGEDSKECEFLKEERKGKPGLKPWTHYKIKDETVFRAQIGPPGGDRGYTAFTGIRGWGLCWWINGLLIPELTVKRGVTYTFIVEGGNVETIKSQFHPLYITNNKEGGGDQYKDELWTPEHMIYAGVTNYSDNGGDKLKLTGVGRLCEYVLNGIDKSDSIETFEEYNKTVTLRCQNGEPGELKWTPDDDTPDTVYYQCFTHRNFGWKINVIGGNRTGSGVVINSSFSFPLNLFLVSFILIIYF